MRRAHPVRPDRRARAVGAVAVAAGCSLIAVLAGALSSAAAQDTGTPPGYVQTIGGSGAADMYPSGMEVAPDGSIVVADTGNNRIAKYTAAGALVWSAGSYGQGPGLFNNPRDVGVDSAGNIYAADTGNLRIVKLSPAGGYQTFWKGPAGDPIKSPIGITVAHNLIYLADGGAQAVRVFDLNGNQIRKITSNSGCTFAAVRDATADSAGNIYVANYTRNNILKLSSTGSCLTTWGSKGTGNGQFANPYGVAVAHDPVRGADLVYVADSNNERIQVFTLTGGYVGQMGVAGDHDTMGTFTQLRRVAVAADGDVWGADLWGWRVERFDRSATGWTGVQRIGDKVPQLTDTAAFHEPREISFDAAGNLHVTDTVHHRVVIFTESGHVLGSCGLRGSADGELNWPRGNAVDTSTGQQWIADTKQSRLQVMDSDCSNPAILGTKGTGAGQFNWPMAIAIRQSDRTLWVADTNNNRITVWSLNSRTALTSYGSAGSGTGHFSQPRGITVAPDGHIWVADRGNNRIVELTAGSGGSGIAWVRTINQSFAKPEGVAVGADGRIYVADTMHDRLVTLASDGSVLGTTSGPTGLNDPSAVAVGPDDRIYVADTINDRVQVFSWNAPPPDTTEPDSAISQPAANATVASPVTVAGTATDDRGVAGIQISIQDRTSKLWWHPSSSSWAAGVVWIPATLGSPGQPSTGWSTTVPLAGGSGLAAAFGRATDTSGNVESTRPSVRFTVT